MTISPLPPAMAAPGLVRDLEPSAGICSLSNGLKRACDAVLLEHGGPWKLEQVADVMHALTPAVQRVMVTGQVLPWGRYLVVADPHGRYNLQLDVFSPDYQGGLHAHGTFGIFWVLQGQLHAWDYAVGEGGLAGLAVESTELKLARAAIIPAGGSSCFCPPDSDWHRVSTPASGPQTISLHLYGPNFDLEVGRGMLSTGRAGDYRRSPFRPLAEALPGLSWRSEGGPL